MRPALQIILITAIFVGLYPLLRSLPDAQCNFLHYDYKGETDEGTELCGLDNSAVFLDLQRVRFPVRARLESATPPHINEAVTLTLDLTMPDGRPLAVEELAVVHTKKLHLFVISPNLKDYHHLHPQPVDTPGRYQFTLTPQYPGRYTVFAECVPLRSASIVIAQTDFDVRGQKSTGIDSPLAQTLPQAIADRYTFSLSLADDKPWLCGTNQEFILRIIDRQGSEPLALTPVMGAYAHLVAFDEKRRGLAHMHPLNEGEGLGSPQAQFRFSLRTDSPGNYAIWAQIKLMGEERFIPFSMTAVEDA